MELTAIFTVARRRVWPRGRFGRAVLFATLPVVLLAACDTGGNVGDPFSRSLGWFNFLAGTDIRQGCVPGGPDRYRLIYNAIWGEQVRVYAIASNPDGGAAAMTQRVFFPETVNAIDLRAPLDSFSGARAALLLSPAEIAQFRAALAASGFDAAAPRGTILPSDGFYWVVAACRSGIFHFNAYLYPSDRFAAIVFDRWLFAHDQTGVKVAQPHAVPPRSAQRLDQPSGDTVGPSIFDMTVGENGLVGVGSLF